MSALRRARPSRDRHVGHVRRQQLVLVSLPVAAQGRRPHGPRARRSLVPGPAVHGRSRARRDAPAVLALLHQSVAGHRPRQGRRAVPEAVQPGPDPGRRRRANEQVARQRPGSRRPGRALRRGHHPAVPDVHGPVGPGWPVELDRDRWGLPVPEPCLDAGIGSDGPGAR